MDVYVQIFAWVAACFQLSGYLFQAGKTIISKKVKDLSLSTFVTNFIGTYIWAVSALLVRSFQQGIVNALALTAISIIVGMILIDRGISRRFIGVMMFFLMVFVWTLAGALVIDNYISQFISFQNDVIKLSVGIFGGIFTSTAFLPQFTKIIKSKTAQNLSYALVGLYGTSQLTWALYWGLRSTEVGIGDWLSGFIFSVLTASLQYAIFSYKLWLTLRKKK